ncbi:AMP-binding protein [Kitasatospora sp. NBC_01250]|uniref:AMP-binding protein n=1 Tax=Kitasatospora sp. NBC_01250 TaxID=2903571 RepID=UPI002E36DB79|nr:AMP-binding protein [Kitasatospora sp. NBC_01250]
MSGDDQAFGMYVEENLNALARWPEREAVVHGERRISAGELRELIYRMARALLDQGLGSGTTITLLSGNLPETIAVRYAANLIGCTVNHLYNKLSADVQAAIVRDIETTALIVDPRLADRATELLDLAPVSTVLTLGPAGVGKDLLELAAGQSAEPLAALAKPTDIMSIRHTGGTTGHPKGICTTFRQAEAFQRKLEELAEVERQLVCTTLAHVAGHLADRTLGGGGTVVLLEDFDAAEVLATVERERITQLFVLPPLLYQVLDHPDAATTDTSSLRSVVYGGCPASPARLLDALRRFGPVLFQFYGQNEVGGISTLGTADHDPERPELLRSAGKVLPGVEVEIRDPEGRALPTGELGEICVRSDAVMEGYWKQPELTAEVLRGGWLHTGDLGRFDEEGYLYILDRLKDMIIVVGGHVYTTELEEVLNAHPQVLQSAVFGVPDADRMEQVHAVIVLAPEATVDEAELRAMVREERGAMYEPARITFAEALPLTDVGKPDKKLLRRRAEEQAA